MCASLWDTLTLLNPNYFVAANTPPPPPPTTTDATVVAGSPITGLPPLLSLNDSDSLATTTSAVNQAVAAGSSAVSPNTISRASGLLPSSPPQHTDSKRSSSSTWGRTSSGDHHHHHGHHGHDDGVLHAAPVTPIPNRPNLTVRTDGAGMHSRHQSLSGLPSFLTGPSPTPRAAAAAAAAGGARASLPLADKTKWIIDSRLPSPTPRHRRAVSQYTFDQPAGVIGIADEQDWCPYRFENKTEFTASVTRCTSSTLPAAISLPSSLVIRPLDLATRTAGTMLHNLRRMSLSNKEPNTFTVRGHSTNCR
jgi:hypothetical protein